MKIAVSSMSKDLNSMLDVRFGRCNYFVIYDTEEGLVKTIENKGQMSGGGAGIAAAQQIIDEDVDVVITGNMGPNAFNLFKNLVLKSTDVEALRLKRLYNCSKKGS